MISFFQLPKEVLKRLDYFRSRFFCQGDRKKKKYQDLEVKNRALLGQFILSFLL
jgi:hypothetical protein